MQGYRVNYQKIKAATRFLSSKKCCMPLSTPVLLYIWGNSVDLHSSAHCKKRANLESKTPL